MELQEIESAVSHFKVCPKCNSIAGFWLGLKSDHAYVQCKGCGAKFELREVFMMRDEDRISAKSGFFKR